jgi:DNA primase
VEAGLAIRDERGVWDRFRARITFPVHDGSGNAVGIGARLLEGDGPKYLNSPETPVYRKQELLYNLGRAKGEISRSERAFLVEGYTDVIALHQAGVRTAVATCGTALSEGHLRLLSRFARQVVLAFDSDEAGARAAERAYGFFEAYPLEVQVLILPRGEDPADFVSAHGAAAFEELAGGAGSLVEYMIERALRGRDLESPEGKTAAVRDALPLVAGLADAVRRSRYASVLADRVDVPTESVLLELERRRRTEEQAGGAGGDGGADRSKPRVRDAGREVEREALKLLAQHPELCVEHAGALSDDRFATERHRRALELLRAPRSSASELADRAREQGMEELVAELSLEPLKGDSTPEYAGRVFSRLEERGLKRRIDTMRKRLERLNPVTDAETFDPMFKELADLTGRWREARARAGEGA